MTRRRRHDTGIALIGAMLVAAVVAGIATTLTVRDQLALRALARGRESSTVQGLQQSLEAQAARALAADAESSAHDAEDEPWYAMRFEYAGAAMVGTASLEDAQGRFNLNSLSFEAPDLPAGAARANSGPTNEAGAPTAEAVADAGPAAVPTDTSSTAGPTSAAPAAQSASAAAVALPPVPLPGSAAGGLEACGDSGTCVRDQSGAGQNAARVEALRGKGRPPDSPAAVSALAAVAATAGIPMSGAGAPPSGVSSGATAPPAGVVVGEGEAQEPNDAGGRGSGLSDQQVAMARFHLLLRALELPPELLPAILDWLDADGDPRYPSGAEDEFYSLREPPYRAANRRFEEVSELRLVRGVTEEIYERLRPFVTVLDNPTPINVNTAAPEVLMSLAPGIDRSSAELLVRSRAAQSFVDLETLLAHPLLVGRPIVATGLSTDSNWFELRTRIDGEGLPHHRVSLMYRAGPDRIVTLRRRHVYPDG